MERRRAGHPRPRRNSKAGGHQRERCLEDRAVYPMALCGPVTGSPLSAAALWPPGPVCALDSITSHTIIDLTAEVSSPYCIIKLSPSRSPPDSMLFSKLKSKTSLDALSPSNHWHFPLLPFTAKLLERIPTLAIVSNATSSLK